MSRRALILLLLFAGASTLALLAWWAGSSLLASRRAPIRVGVLHSLTGPLAVSEAPVVEAWRLAAEELNAAGGVLGRPIELVVVDGGSDPTVFAREAERLLGRHGGGVDLLAGTWTSSSRKALLPVLEKHRSLLLYPVQFEGLEESPFVVYLGAAPNQQLGPAVEWAMERGLRRVTLVGSSYVYPVAANRIARDLVVARGGEIVAEVYLPLTGGNLVQVAEEIAASKPDLVISTVNGEANQGLMRALRAAGFNPATTPIIALSISEAELRAWEPGLFTDVIVPASYFRTVPHPENHRFLTALRTRGASDAAGDAMVSAYKGLHLWAQAAARCGSTAPADVRRALRVCHGEGPGGTFLVDPQSLYTAKVMRLGRVRRDGDMEIIWDSEKPVSPQAWPVWRSRAEWQSFINDLQTRWGGQWQGEVAPSGAGKAGAS
ncbi:MAG: transporter substrate-binding protein [Phycisphaeraceae bacterium]|nr:transporter substrate-binding protein [Phycisphaeraceae bacterium]